MFRLPALMKTTAARLTALFMLLFAACALVLVVYVSSLSQRMITTQTQEAILEEMSSLTAAYQRRGLTGLVRVISIRSRQPGANLYLITDHNGLILSGNVEMIEPGVLDVTGWTDRPFYYSRYGEATDPQDLHQAVAHVSRLPNQMILLVGRDLGEPEQYRNIVRRALMAALGMMGLGAALIWFFVGRRALRRIDSISDASRQIMGGDLARRLPVSGSGDEFDRLSENLNGMLERIAALNEGLKQVSDNIAHDLKTPLTRLRNRAEAALAEGDDEHAAREALERTIAESDQLIRTFNAILMISRLEAGYSAETTKSVDLAAIIEDVVELYEPAAEEVGVTLKSEIPGSVEISGNRELLAQALSNIVDNAIKYSAGTGEEPTVTVLLTSEAGTVRLAVIDNGPGIPENQRNQATERFVRLEKSRNQPGSGLGLSLAKAVMTFHHGELELALGRNESGLSVAMVFPNGKNG